VMFCDTTSSFNVRFSFTSITRSKIGPTLNMIWRRSLVFEGEPALPGADKDSSRA